ncbi:MAG: hypothetical protein Q4F95_09260 [Oscillospiraceae bacterium]|nr:hypothetical protein [Oscillospiraceae bacterium]
MILDITESFLYDVNMDPDLGKETCITYLIFDPDELYNDKISLKLINFDLNTSHFLDELRMDSKMEHTLKGVTCLNAPSLFCNMPVNFEFTGIKGFELCILDDKQKKIYKSTSYKLKKGDLRFRLTGKSSLSQYFVVLNLIGNTNAKVCIDFAPNDCIYNDEKNINISYNQYKMENIKNPKWEDFINSCYKERTKMFDFDFVEEYFPLFALRAIKDEK